MIGSVAAAALVSAAAAQAPAKASVAVISGDPRARSSSKRVSGGGSTSG